MDNGQTGTNFERPEFERLLQDIRSGKTDCIVVKDLSRFGRNYRETGNYLERVFPFLDVRFVAIADGFDTLTAEHGGDGCIIPLKNIINEVYSRDISGKIGSALAVKQRKGEFIGSWAAYGYRKCKDDRHRLEPDTETAPVVREIFRQRLSGISCMQIARKLNGQGIPSPSRYHYLKGDAKSERYANAVWKPPVIRRILSNEVYLGHMVQGRRRESFYEGKARQTLPASEWIIVRNTHEPVIDEETFRAVQKIAEDGKTAYRERAEPPEAEGKGVVL
ncbi:MAG: recombinase family protein [Bacteroides fragilis]|nr:recombinase family protein [Bacteroides fragilis]